MFGIEVCPIRTPHPWLLPVVQLAVYYSDPRRKQLSLEKCEHTSTNLLVQSLPALLKVLS